ncbi:MAG TPA: TetR/AcrR family transcriptional regulator [Burkholderiaceae bacterium]|jgi:AcrR family transcriptional regulator|nr:TetR/AcrR family transcriptional regulator [Burkholderiaceae bacterium]
MTIAEPDSLDARSYHHGDLRRALIVAARALVTENQDWTFSLRQVARRAGVSHNAPYNHFPEKQELLAAIAADAFDTLRERLLSVIAPIENPRDALVACAHTYVQNGIENPALYRLMFGPVLPTAKVRPAVARDSGYRTRAVLEEIVLRGARSGTLAASPESKEEIASAVLSLWSAVHGLTMFVIDDIAGSTIPVPVLVDRLLRTQLDGLAPR